MEITSRTIAKQAGLKKYFTGEICKNGHYAERYTQSGSCTVCTNGHVEVDLRTVGQSDKERIAADNLSIARQIQAEALDRARALTEERTAKQAEAQRLQTERQETEAKRKAGKAMLLRKKVMSPADRWLDMRQIVITLTRLRCEQLLDEDIIPKNPYIGNFIYQVMIHPDDFEAFQTVSETFRKDAQTKHEQAQLARPGFLSPAQSLVVVDMYEIPRFYDVDRDTWLQYKGHWYTRSDLLEVEYKDYARKFGVPQNPASYRGRKITASDLEELDLKAVNGYVNIGGNYFREWDIARLQRKEITHINAVLPL